MDNGTTVETFKYFNYCQLAKTSLVSKRFWNLIRTHRHKLALLYVDSIEMMRTDSPLPTEVEFFNKKLSPEKYNEWVMRNQYSKHIPFEKQVAGGKQFRGVYYFLNANSYYKDQSQRKYGKSTRVFFARTKLNNDSWPLFQHLALLLSDPFVYIRDVSVLPNIFILITRAMNLERNRLRCEQFGFTIDNNAKKFFGWIKEHMSCQEIKINDASYSTCHDEALLDFFVTAAHCTSAMRITFYHDVSKLFVDLVQKFMDVKNCDEYQFVESITGFALDELLAGLKQNYPKSMFKEGEEDGDRIEYFKCVNNDIGKQLKLSSTSYESNYFSLKIDNL